MQKYITLSIIVMFWILLPHIFLFIGVNAVEKRSIEELTTLEEPTIINLAFIFVNWIAFYFKVLTWSLPGATALVKLILIAMLVISGLIFVSIFRGD